MIERVDSVVLRERNQRPGDSQQLVNGKETVISSDISQCESNPDPTRANDEYGPDLVGVALLVQWEGDGEWYRATSEW